MKVYESEIEEIAKRYFLSKNQYKVESFSSGKEDYFNPYYQYYRNIEIAFSKLDEDSKLIINNDYFYNSYFGWWKVIFTEREYLSKKKKAKREFIKYVNQIN